MQGFRNCHEKFLNAAAQFDSKLEAVIGIETNNV